MGDLGARLDSVRERIHRAAARAGRDPASIRLVAVSKTFPANSIREAARAGQRDFGENKVQEALAKIVETADLALSWHLVGHLQSNKARKAAECFDVIHSVDDVALLERLETAAASAARTIDLLVQVDLAGETTKFGAKVEHLGTIFETGRSCKFVRLKGLMILPPEVADPSAARPYFQALRKVRDDLRKHGVEASMLSELSMGMSHDFDVAIEEGATIVRVGSAIFGRRE